MYTTNPGRRLGHFFAMLAVFCSFAVGQLHAQSLPISSIASLTIELWPDYDQPELLVLLTMGFPPNTPLPAQVTLPIPADGRVNAVARITSDGTMIDDIGYEVRDGQIFVPSPELALRVEYYVPYEAQGEQKNIDFEWVAPVDVLRVDVTVQQPQNASNFELNPPGQEIRVSTDGLDYHLYGPRTLLTGDAVTLNLSYQLTDNQLSVPPSSDAPDIPQTTAERLQQNLAANWPFAVAGGFTLLIAIYFLSQGLQERSGKRPRQRKPSRQRGPVCSNCDHQNQPGARFCASCGEKL